ncbi:Mitochondrial import inner membrane translocase subunit Tim17/Tim22/Tim23 family protein [Perilla frutescens var. hirtella]|nr:Mitochondrial import inner membrane translocase subunit Tim17/Tim22/Tim23 family protein [Perilla frutescens var. hirtella]KAH6812481.1 Mitochondrial import inner membrane translocase subunit Tim17/Tim22/Tim23 family protein [Perilla frutescens var. frutescens]KAH6812849.1 Mitochondrial import inner membrane translocase subunit Tim17/Tim22/Tim23 family protein [Perilla frutescens var. frutescens]
MDVEDLKKMEDEESSVMKTMKGATTGLVAGTFWGMVVATWHDVPRVERNIALPGLIRTLKMMGNHGATFAAIGGLYMGVEQLVQKQRMKRDYINGAVGGFVAGALVFGFKGKSIPSAMSAGGTFAATSAILEVLGIEKRETGRVNYVYTREKRPNPNAN